MNSLLRKHWYVISVLLVLLLAISLRFYKLGLVPHGMFWDEAAVGYNGYSIITTRRDEWLAKLPISFQSFGDYKAPLGIYINGLSTYLFGMNLWAVRFPFALISIFGILGIMLLTFEVFKKNKYSFQYSIVAGFIMTLSPWHFHYSRVGFDSGIAMTILIWALVFFIKTLETNFKSIVPSLLSVFFFAASVYAYHSSKVVVPLLSIVIFILFFKKIKKYFKRLIVPILFLIILLIPFLKDSFFDEGLTRASVTIFSSNISFSAKILYVAKSYLLHLSPQFLLLGKVTTLRHGTSYLGVLFITTLFLAVIGLISLLVSNQKTQRQYHYLFTSLLFLGLLPAAISMEIPHSGRSSLALPGFIVLAIYGLNYAIKIIKESKLNATITGSHKEKDIVLKSFIGTLIVFHIFFSISYLSNYFTVFAQKSADSFQDGYLEAFKIAQKYEKGDGVEQVDKIIFTSKYGQPYIYALFVRKTNPIWYRGGSLIKYEFSDNINIGDLSRNNALVVGSNSDDLPIEKADYIVYGSDGKMRFQIYKTSKK